MWAAFRNPNHMDEAMKLEMLLEYDDLGFYDKKVLYI